MPELFYELDAQFTPLLPLSVGVAMRPWSTELARSLWSWV